MITPPRIVGCVSVVALCAIAFATPAAQGQPLRASPECGRRSVEGAGPIRRGSPARRTSRPQAGVRQGLPGPTRRGCRSDQARRAAGQRRPCVCVPYGMPRMMAVASYPVEILETSGTVHDRHRGIQRGAARLHGPTAASHRRSASRLLRPFGGALGRRDACDRHSRNQGIRARLSEHSAQRSDAHHRATAAGGA